MKKAFPIALLLVSTGWFLRGDAQEAGQDSPLEARVVALEKALADEEKAHTETRAILDQTVEYLQASSQSAGRMMGVLDSVEAAGFTAGINYKSREMLLAGLRDQYRTAQASVPQSKPSGARGGAQGVQRRTPRR